MVRRVSVPSEGGLVPAFLRVSERVLVASEPASGPESVPRGFLLSCLVRRGLVPSERVPRVLVQSFLRFLVLSFPRIPVLFFLRVLMPSFLRVLERVLVVFVRGGARS